MAFIFLTGLILICASVLYWRGEHQAPPTTRIVTPLPAIVVSTSAVETKSDDNISATAEALNVIAIASDEALPEASSPLEVSAQDE